MEVATGRLTLANASQYENAPSPMEVAAGMFTSLKLEQPVKAPS